MAYNPEAGCAESVGRKKYTKLIGGVVKWNTEEFSVYDGETDDYLIEVKNINPTYTKMLLEKSKLVSLLQKITEMKKKDAWYVGFFGDAYHRFSIIKIARLIISGELKFQSIYTRKDNYSNEMVWKKVVFIPFGYGE